MKTKTPIMRKLLALLAVLCLACTMALPTFAAVTNEMVTQDTTGVVQVKVVYTDENQNTSDITSGTGFLINNSTVVTCDHVVTLDDELLARAAETFGKSTAEVKDRLGIEISVLRDVTIRATVRNQSAEMDYAILNLESQLYDRTYLPIRASASVQQTEAVYALGFPGEVEYFQDVNTYTSDDVTITSGQVNKINTVGGVDYIQSSARITAGNSGGPLVDAEGNVVGICQGATGTGFDTNYFYAIAIDQLTRSLDALGIEYTAAGGQTVTPSTPAGSEPAAEEPAAEAADKDELTATVADAQAVALDGYDEASGAAFTEALQNAESVLANEAATQAEVDAAVEALGNAQLNLVPKSGFPIWIVVVAAAVVVAVIVAIVLIVSGKKKKAPQPMPAPNPVPVGATAPIAPSAPASSAASPAASGGFAPVPKVPQSNSAPAGGAATSILNAGAGETSILNAGSEETTLLDQNTSFGTLVRSKNKETIVLNNASFVIGKELARVNYCVSDNTSVSRTHARLTSRNGAVYVTDLKTTNGTFINGVRINPNQETELHDGDKLALADEEFIFKAK